MVLACTKTVTREANECNRHLPAVVINELSLGTTNTMTVTTLPPLPTGGRGRVNALLGADHRHGDQHHLDPGHRPGRGLLGPHRTHVHDRHGHQGWSVVLCAASYSWSVSLPVVCLHVSSGRVLKQRVLFDCFFACVFVSAFVLVHASKQASARVCVCVCVSVCLSVCLPVCLSACLCLWVKKHTIHSLCNSEQQIIGSKMENFLSSLSLLIE